MKEKKIFPPYLYILVCSFIGEFSVFNNFILFLGQLICTLQSTYVSGFLLKLEITNLLKVDK